MRLWPRALSLRLALLFALVGVLLLGAIGFYLYASLEREIAWRDDQALLGRLERMRGLLDDSASIAALRQRPQLYGNMLGNRDSLLWILDAEGRALIEVNPAQLALPRLTASPQVRLADSADGTARLAWLQVPGDADALTLVAGKLLAEREQMLAAYRLKLWLALAVGALLAFLLGWALSQHALRPLRRLAARAEAIDAQHLHLRLAGGEQVSELRGLSVALDRMLARLEDGFAQLSRFSEDLAHEMRTPLGNLMGQTQQALRQPRSSEEYENLLASCLEEYERLARMIDSMLFLARSEQPQTQVCREAVDLAALADQLCEYFEGMAEERELRLLNHAQGSLQADAQLLRRALANLLANALRHATPGTAVSIYSQQTATALEIAVHNAGEPIGAEHLPRLFERFYRCDPSRAQPGDTGGLGLAIVRSIMQLHGGSVRVSSDAEGTRFILVFPLAAG